MSKSKKQGQPQEVQEQLSNTIRLPNSRVYLRSGDDYWKVLGSCEFLMSNSLPEGAVNTGMHIGRCL